MGRIILILLLLASLCTSAQSVRMRVSLEGFRSVDWIAVPGYTNINARYKWIATAVDSGLHIPQYNGVPSGTRVGVWAADGAIAADTANGYIYLYSGGAWIKFAKYSDIGSAYTFPQSVVAPGSAIQLENDTSAAPANYFYGRNSAGRRGWYPQSGIVGTTPTLQQVVDAGNNTTGNTVEIFNDTGYPLSIRGQGDLTDTKIMTVVDSDIPTRVLNLFNTSASSSTRNIEFPNASGTIALSGSITNGQYTMASSRLLGRSTGGTGSIEEITLGTGLSFTGTTLNVSSSSPAGNFGNIQINRNSLFDSPASDSLDFDGGLVVKGTALASSYIQAGADLRAKPSYTSDWVSSLGYSGNGTSAYGTLILREFSTGGGNTVSLNAVPTLASDINLYLPETADGDTLATKAYARSVGGGGGTPAGNFGNIQINRNGAFAVPGSDSLDWESATGLTTKGVINVVGVGNYINMNNGSSATSVNRISFGPTYDQPALALYEDPIGTISYGWGLRAGNMQFFMTDVAKFTVNKGGAFQASGTNELFVVDANTSLVTTKIRFASTQGADVASAAGAIALGSDGNSFEITGTASITLISNTNWVNGSEVSLIFTSTATLVDGTANSGTDIGMELEGNTNFVGSAGTVVKLLLSEVGGTQRWRMSGKSVN